jgi:hypothetical protein
MAYSQDGQKIYDRNSNASGVRSSRNGFFYSPIKDVVRERATRFRAEMPGTDAWVWPNNIYVSAKVMGGAVWEMFGRLKWMDRQRFALTATATSLSATVSTTASRASPLRTRRVRVIVVTDTWPLTIPSGTKVYRATAPSHGTRRKTSTIHA